MSSGGTVGTIIDNKAIVKTRVFLAWSGVVSQKMAMLLKKYLPLFVRNIDIFISEDIDKGKRWNTEIATALGTTKFGILCLTSENLSSEWIHFEAGALSKTINDANVCPLLLDVKKSELKEPLASFQATLFERGEFKKLVNTLTQACGDILEEEQLNTLMDGLWIKIEESLKGLKEELAEIRKKKGKPEESKPAIGSMLEEIVTRIREQGRLLPTIIEQNETNSIKVINHINSLKENQKRTMFTDSIRDKHRILMQENEDNSLTSKGYPAYFLQLAKLINNLDSKIKNEKPEIIFDSLINAGEISEDMYVALGGRAGIYDAIHKIMTNTLIIRQPERSMQSDTSS